jgi:hypothetical protein
VNASQQQYGDEVEEIRQTDEDVEEAKSITRLKKKEWELIEWEQEQDKADKKEAERNKPMLLLMQDLKNVMQHIQTTSQSGAVRVAAIFSSASSSTATVPPTVGNTTTRFPQRLIRREKRDWSHIGKKVSLCFSVLSATCRLVMECFCVYMIP